MAEVSNFSTWIFIPTSTFKKKSVSSFKHAFLIAFHFHVKIHVVKSINSLISVLINLPFTEACELTDYCGHLVI